MNNKLELRTKMMELQKEYSSLNEELKALEREEKAAEARLKYKDYKFKIGVWSYKVEPEEKMEEITDEDRERADTGKSGLVYTGFAAGSDFSYIMLKERSDYARTVRVCDIIDAVAHLASDKVKDKEPYIKIILGES